MPPALRPSQEGPIEGGGWGSSLPLARRIRRTCFTISSITSAKLFMPPAGARLWGGTGDMGHTYRCVSLLSQSLPGNAPGTRTAMSRFVPHVPEGLATHTTLRPLLSVVAM